MLVNNVTKTTLHGIAKEHILPDSIIYTDEYPAGRERTGEDIRLPASTDYAHSSGVYVVGNTHALAIEGFLSFVKSRIGVVYHLMSNKYLQTYLDEYSFRYDRNNQNQSMLTSLLAEVSERAS
jgi:transposase-like protein